MDTVSSEPWQTEACACPDLTHHLQKGTERLVSLEGPFTRDCVLFLFPLMAKARESNIFQRERGKKKRINQDEQMPNFCSQNGGDKVIDA